MHTLISWFYKLHIIICGSIYVILVLRVARMQIEDCVL